MWQTDGQTDRQTTDKVIPKWRFASLAPQQNKNNMPPIIRSGGIKNKDEYHMWPDQMYLVQYRPRLDWAENANLLKDLRPVLFVKFHKKKSAQQSWRKSRKCEKFTLDNTQTDLGTKCFDLKWCIQHNVLIFKIYTRRRFYETQMPQVETK